MRRSSSFIVAGIMALTLAGAACASDDSSTPADGGSSSGSPSEVEEATDVSGMSEVDMEVDSFYFEPATLQGTAAQSLSIHLENESDATHTFTIDDQDVDVELAAGESADVDVTFPEADSVTFYCRFHVSSGMEGELTVT
ncbi:MAG: cupredoxin domain-containing protein [Actinomycetota bacterium]